MDDLICLMNKTSELANVVNSLQQQGEDNSDLRGIIAQLEEAVAKRSTQPVASTSGNMLTEAKVEPTDVTTPAEDQDTSTAPHAGIATESGVRKTKNTPKSSKQSVKQRTAKSKSKSSTEKSPARRKPAPRSRQKNIYKDYDMSSDESDSEHMDVDSFNIGVVELKVEEVEPTISALMNPYTGAMEEGDELVEQDTVRGKSLKKSVTNSSMRFHDCCKLCEVQFNMERRSSEVGQVMISEPSMMLTPNLPIYPTLTSFALHLKAEHMISETTDETSSSGILDNQNDEQHNEDTAGTKKEPKEGDSTTKEPSQAFYMACPHCGKRYNFHGTAKSCYDQCVSHMHRKHGEALPSHVTLYNCPECSFQTLRKRDLTRHTFVMHTDHESRGVPCEICGKCVLPSSMVFHMAAVHDSEDVPEQVKARTAKAPCHVCGKEFRGEINLQRHIKCVHSKIKEQLCHLCSQSFFAKRELQLHMFSTHKINMSNMKVHKCPSEGCDYETLAKRHLYIHSAVHTDTKEFTCHICGKAFKSKPALSQHLRIMHTKDTDYQCPKCSFTSHAKQYVQRHMVIHSDHKKHKCDFESCTYATHFIENLTKHKRKHRISKDSSLSLEVGNI